MFSSVNRLSFTLDGWTSPFHTSFLGVTAHWLDDQWRHQDLTVGFEPLSGSHTAELLLEAFVAVLRRFNLQKKVHSITSDNGSNVLRMMDLFSELTRKDTEEW